MDTIGRIWRRTGVWWRVAALVAVVVAVGVGAFFGVLGASNNGGNGTPGPTPSPEPGESPTPTPFPDYPGPDVTPLPGATPDTSQPWWYVPYLNAEQGKPLFNGTLAGIRIFYGADYGNVCPKGALAPMGTFESTVGTPVSLKPSYLPAGAGEPQNVLVGLCNDEPAIGQATYYISSDPSIPRYGGSIDIFRHKGAAAASLAIPAHRWHEGTIAGHPAAIAEPILPDLGLGESAVVVYYNGVLTEVHADGIPMDQVLKVAESLFP